MTIQVGRVGMIPLNSIIVTDRTRKEMGDLDSLELTLKESGLISPLAVKDNQDSTFTLLAGERRFTVLKRNEVETIPARIYDRELTPLEMKIIEKAENFHRKDMAYWELDALTLEIHSMQQELEGVKAHGPSTSGHGMKDTGEMLGASKASVSQSIKRAEARQAFPELFETCKTASDASKVIKKLDEAVVKQTIAQKLESQKSNGSLQKLSKCYVLKDFFEGVKDIPNNIMHLVEIDPPYAINLTKQKKKDGESSYILEDYNEIDEESYECFLLQTFKECYRIMTDHSWIICWFAPEPHFELVYKSLRSTGFETTRMCGIWVKSASGQNMNPSIKLSNSYEMFFYAWKGRPVLNKAGKSNTFHTPPISPRDKVHPTERPIGLMEDIYNTFAFQGSRVLIPFLGSGNGLIASYNLGLDAIGFELSKSYKDSFLVRVDSLLGRVNK